MSKGMFKRIVIVVIPFMLIAGTAAFLYLRQHRVPSDPQQLLYAALETALKQPGITCTIERSGSLASRQQIELDLEDKSRARAVATATSGDGSSVTTEEIVVPGHDYIRYTSVKNEVKQAERPNLSKAINVWAERKTPRNLGLFARASMSDCIVPLTNLSPKQADVLVAKARKDGAFDVGSRGSAIEQQGTRNYRVYEMDIRPEPYVAFMKDAAKAYGLSDLESVENSAFRDRSTAPIKMYVDTSTGQIARIEQPEIGRRVTLTSYGKKPEITPPKNAVPISELEKRIQP